MGKAIIIICVLGLVMYLLYINGYLITNAKRAISYVGSLRGRKASFSSCTGYTKRVIKFSENRAYQFSLALELSKGTVCVEITNKQKEVVVRLDRENVTSSAFMSQDNRYYMTVRFEGATGKYEVSWD